MSCAPPSDCLGSALCFVVRRTSADPALQCSVATNVALLHPTGMIIRPLALAAAVGAAFVVGACSDPPPPPPPPVVEAPKAPIVDDAQRKMFQALPANFGEASDARVQLGRVLFHDPRLSAGQDISCNSCHTLENYGVDGKATSSGFKGQLGGRNSPTVYNAAGHTSQFWDGRAAHVEEQSQGPVLNPVEMAIKDDKAAVAIIRSIPGYEPMFLAAFPDDKGAITWDNYAKAVGAFERQLVTPSRFDAWAKGDDTALTEEEQKGALAFMQTGCMACHMGPLLGGTSFQKAGMIKAWPNEKDRGRKDLTKQDLDDMMFKVPSLRNIEKTAPYFHDGQTATLEEAVKMMARHQLGRELADADVSSIVSFLKSLTGELPKALIATPALPESGPKTPKAMKG